MKKAIRARILRPISEDKVEDISDGLLLIDENGLIDYVGKFNEVKVRDLEVEKLSNKIILPGFTDCHTHLSQVFARNKSGETLINWLHKYIFAEESKFQNLNYAKKASEFFFNELIKNGTTMSGVLLSPYFDAGLIAFDEAIKSGLKVLMGKAMMDRNCPEELCENTNDSLKFSDELYERFNNSNNRYIKYAYYPRFALTCSEKLLCEISERVKSGAYVHTHLAETKLECEEALRLFKDAKDYLSIYENLNLLGNKTIFAHTIYLNDDEFKRISTANSKIVHCPSANLFLKSGRFPIELADKNNVNYALGSDVGAGPEFSMLVVAKDAEFIQDKTEISVEKLFYLATAGGANLLGWDGYNSFSKNTPADFVVIDLENSVSNTKDILSKIIFDRNENMIEKTYINGELKYKKGE